MKEPKKKEMQSEDELEDSVLEALQKDIVELKKQNDEYLDSLQRERASFANYKRRIDQDNADLQDRALADNVKVFLPVVDDMERALNHRPDELTVSQWVEGLQLILQKSITPIANFYFIGAFFYIGSDYFINLLILIF